MGEITDALRRAERERDRNLGRSEARREDAPAPLPVSPTGDDAWEADAVLTNRSGPQTERFRHFALQVRRSLDARRTRSLMITSALQGEGKTFVACNLALALASMAGDNRIALLDLDLHHPSIATTMGVDPGCGVETVLLGEKELRSARVRTDIFALDLYPVARRVSHPHEVLAQPSLRTLIHDLSKEYATVICDSPPALPAPDAGLIAPHVGSCVLVAKAGVTRRMAFREMISMLPRENLMGTFLNFSVQPRHTRGYGYSRYMNAEERRDDLEPLDASDD